MDKYRKLLVRTIVSGDAWPHNTDLPSFTKGLIMKSLIHIHHFRHFASIVGLTTVMAVGAGCVGISPISVGQSQADVRAAWGAPTMHTKTGAGERWTYSTAPEGREFWLLEFDASGRLLSRTQGLTLARVTQVQNGQKQPEVEALIGPSYWTLRYPFRPDELVHVYRFNDVVTPTCFYVGYDVSGVVTSTGMQEENRGRSGFGMARPC